MSTTTKKTKKKDQPTAPTSAENACKAIDLVATTSDAKPPLTNTEILKAAATAIAEENVKKVEELRKKQLELAKKIYQFKIAATIAAVRSATDEELSLAVKRDDYVENDDLYRLTCEVKNLVEDQIIYSKMRFSFQSNEKDKLTIKLINEELIVIIKSIKDIVEHDAPKYQGGKQFTYNLCRPGSVFELLSNNQKFAKAESTDRIDKILADPELRDALMKAGQKLLSFTPANRNAIEA